MKPLRLALVFAMLMLLPEGVASSQSYEQVPVKVSSDKVRRDGKLYFAHAVQERQTLFSIAKAYGVSVDAIVAANPDKDLAENGPAKGSILLIPSEEPIAETASDDRKQEEDSITDDGKYVIHVVKWYDDLSSIADKYGVSEVDIRRANNLTGDKLKKRSRLRIPIGSTAEETEESVRQEDAAAEADTEEAQPEQEEEEREQRDFLGFLRKSDKVRFSILLPFNSQGGNASIPYMDFYSGALLALRDLGRDGISADVSVVDVSGGISAADLSDKDFVIGPVSVSGLGKVISESEGRIPVISPLDQEAAALTDTCRALAQVPSSHETQYADLVKWLAKDFRREDKVIVVHSSDGKGADTAAWVDTLLSENDIPYSTLSYGVLQGRNMAGRMGDMMSSGTTRVILASEDEAFANDVVRNLNLMVHRGKSVVFYGSSKVRTYKTIDVENLHAINTHLSVPYFIDYDSPAVRDFLLAYRALYNTEPTQFAFQGYDVTAFFVRACHEGGRNWFDGLVRADRTSELQGDFYFSRNGDGGMLNEGVRRIVYTTDYHIIKAE